MKKIKYIGLLFTLGFLFASCSNLVDASDLKEQLENEIELANTEAVTVRVTADENAVKFVSGSGDFSLKPNVKKTVEFKLNTENYLFTGYNVISKSDGITDFASFANLKITNKNDVYTAEITLKKGIPDVVISILTREKPAVKSFEPENVPSGVTCYKPIVIHFTQPMVKEDLSFSNISITNKKGELITVYFKEPQVSDDCKSVVIEPIIDEIKKLFDKNTTAEINVTLSANIRENVENPVAFKECSYSYVINSEKDVTAPSLESIKIYKHVLNLDTETYENRQIDEKAFDVWTSDDFDLHHTNDRILIDCTGYDEGSGIKGFSIKETLIRRASDGDSTEVVATEADFGTGDFVNISDGYYETSLYEYKLRSTSDGVIKVEIALNDYENLKSEQKIFYVISDTGFITDANFEDRYFMMFTKYQNANSAIDPSNGKTLGNKVRIPVNGIDTYENIGCLWTYDQFYYNSYSGRKKCSPLNIKITYWDEGETEVKTFLDVKNFLGTSEYEKTSWLDICDYKFIRNANKNTNVKVKITNEYNEPVEYTYQIPAPQPITSYGWDFATGKISFSVGNEFSSYWYKQKDTDGGEYGEVKRFAGEALEAGKTYSFYFSNGVYLAGYAMDDFIVYSAAFDPLEFKVVEVSGLYAMKRIDYDDSITGRYPNISIHMDDPVPNVGKRNVKINYIDRGDERFKYQLYYYFELAGNKYYTYPVSDSFAVNSGREYKVGFIEMDKYGVILNQQDIEGLTIDATYKNTALLWNSRLSNTEYNKLHIFLDEKTGYDADMSTIETENGMNVFHYWIVEGQPKVSEDLITGQKEYKLYFDGNKRNEIDVELPLKKEGYYTILYKIFDKNRNYYFNSYVFKSFLGDKPDNTKMTYDTTNKVIYFPEPENMYSGNYTVLFQYLDNNEWKDYELNTDYTVESKNNDLGIKLTKNNTDYDKYSKIKVIYSDTARSFLPVTTKPLCINPNAVGYLKTNNVQLNKQVLEGLNGYQILTNSNMSVLCRTVYSEENYGEDIDSWNVYGTEAYIVTAKYSCTYTPAEKKVPANNYYCAIITFADGTSVVKGLNRK